MAKTNEVLSELVRSYGDGIVVEGFEEIERLPTGLFQFDLAVGGGLPFNRVTEVYGKEASGKTNFALRCIVSAQRLHPKKKAVMIDIERTYDPTWGRRMGVDNDALIVIKPDYAEQAVDIVDMFMRAEDVSLIVFDSIGALTTQAEIDKSAEKDTMAPRARVMSKLVNKVTSAFGAVEKEKRRLILLGINQVRTNVGMYGGPEITPGGHAWRFVCSLRVRLFGKPIPDKKVHPTMIARRETSFDVKKYKIPIVSPAGVYEMAMLPHPHKKVKVGEAEFLVTLMKRAEMYGMLKRGKNGKGFIWDGVQFKTLRELVQSLDLDATKADVIKRALAYSSMSDGEENIEGL